MTIVVGYLINVRIIFLAYKIRGYLLSMINVENLIFLLSSIS